MKGVGGARLGKRAQEGGGGGAGMKGVGGEDWSRGHRKVGECREGDGGWGVMVKIWQEGTGRCGGGGGRRGGE